MIWTALTFANAVDIPVIPPCFPPPGIGDLTIAHIVTAGILAALHKRSVTGEGSKVSTSLLASGIWSGYAHITGGQDRPPQDPKGPFRAPIPFKEWRNPFYHIYSCKDGRLFFLLGGAYQKLHRSFHAMGMDDLIDDPNYKDHLTMQENSAPQCRKFNSTTSTHCLCDAYRIARPRFVSTAQTGDLCFMAIRAAHCC